MMVRDVNVSVPETNEGRQNIRKKIRPTQNTKNLIPHKDK